MAFSSLESQAGREVTMGSNLAQSLPALTRLPVRCAIYTRKSTEEGLGQEFNSLDAQREAAEAYIHSQAQANWTCLPHRYDDGGDTGSNLGQPALHRLLAAIQAGHGDCASTLLA